MNPIDFFENHFDRVPARTLFTPGRVNLIGEHTDYNGGNVMPIALDLGVTIAVAPNDSKRVRVASTAFNEAAERNLNERATNTWSDLALGAISAASTRQRGYDVAITSTLPHGAGLSSSAALSVGLIKTIRALESTDISDIDAALLAKSVENDFIGVPCGIMDQFAVSVLQPGECMRLDTLTLKYNCLQPPPGWVFGIHHSGVTRSLSEGRYAIRREECAVAGKTLNVSHLCRMPEPPDYSRLHDPIDRRTRHQVTENKRVLAAEAALGANDLAGFGALMNESHTSMRDDFEITTPEVDNVVAAAREAGAIGARMTGGGFGGCIVSLTREDDYSQWLTKFSALAPAASFVARS